MNSTLLRLVIRWMEGATLYEIEEALKAQPIEVLRGICSSYYTPENVLSVLVKKEMELRGYDSYRMRKIVELSDEEIIGELRTIANEAWYTSRDARDCQELIESGAIYGDPTRDWSIYEGYSKAFVSIVRYMDIPHLVSELEKRELQEALFETVPNGMDFEVYPDYWNVLWEVSRHIQELYPQYFTEAEPEHE